MSNFRCSHCTCHWHVHCIACSSVNEDCDPNCSGHAWLELGDTSKHLIGELGAGIGCLISMACLPISDRIPSEPGWQATQMSKRRAAISGNQLRFKLAAKQREA